MDLASEKTHLLQRDAEWAAAASDGRDIELILSFWTDDAIVIPPGLPSVVGKAALGQYVKRALELARTVMRDNAVKLYGLKDH